MKRTSITVTIALSVLTLLGAPAMALGCVIPFRTIGPITLAKTDIKRPGHRVALRAGWHLDGEWVGTNPELNQVVKVRDVGTLEGVGFAGQRSLSIDAAAPSGNGWVYADDTIDETPPCEIAGQAEWQQPVIFVRQERRQVRIAAAARRTVGSRVGCVLGGGDVGWGCPTLTRTVVRLARPIGSRKLVFERLR